MSALNRCASLPKCWEAATKWRDGGSTGPEEAPAHGGGESGLLGVSSGSNSSNYSGSCAEEVVPLALLRTCLSEQYGAHIPRMVNDLLLDLGKAFAESAGSGAGAAVVPGDNAEAGSKIFSGDRNELLSPADNNSNSSSSSDIPPSIAQREFSEENANSGGKNGGLLEAGGGDAGGRAGVTPPPVFHVTEYDVTKGRYPESWEDYAGYIIPGGVASACGDEPWMLTLLHEAKGLRQSGRPVLAFCLGHQVIAQALGGLVRPRTGPRRHYALQESELLVEAEVSTTAAATATATDIILAAVNTMRRQKEGVFDKGEDGPEVPRMKLLYHHNDEVVELPPGARNIATSLHCLIHGMLMETSGGDEAPRPTILTFQAHPELNYEFGRRVMDGILDKDVAAGRLTHEKSRRLKEQASAWDHTEFPVALELVRRLFAQIVPRRNGGLL